MRAYIDKWEDWDFHCEKCGWKGKGASLENGDFGRYGVEELCPACHEYIAWLEYPLIDELLANMDKLTPEDQKIAIGLKALQCHWNASKLTSVAQLPEIEARYIVLLWDEEPEREEIVIRHGKDEIFRQPTSFEYYDFFIEACRVLKTKYGTRLLDVVPAPRAWVGLGGDRVGALEFTDKMRELIGRDNGFAETEDQQEWREEWKTYRAGL